MRQIGFLHILSIVILLVILCSYSDGYHVAADPTKSLSNKEYVEDFPKREKRQVETFDDEYPTGPNQESQEETGFWDRVVKVALKLFSRFVEWLNS